MAGKNNLHAIKVYAEATKQPSAKQIRKQRKTAACPCSTVHCIELKNLLAQLHRTPSTILQTSANKEAHLIACSRPTCLCKPIQKMEDTTRTPSAANIVNADSHAEHRQRLGLQVHRGWSGNVCIQAACREGLKQAIPNLSGRRTEARTKKATHFFAEDNEC